MSHETLIFQNKKAVLTIVLASSKTVDYQKRLLSSNAKPTFYPCTVFRQPLLFPEGSLNCCWPAAYRTVYYRMREVTGDILIVYDLFCLAARWIVHAKIDSLGTLPYLYNLWCNVQLGQRACLEIQITAYNIFF